jgi:hypothetical protein
MSCTSSTRPGAPPLAFDAGLAITYWLSRRIAEMKFPDLIARISKIDEIARLTGGRTLQQILSLRNWLMGASIVEFEQAGEARAQCGQRLIHTLAKALGGTGCQGLSASNLKNSRQLALAYPGLDAINLGRRLGLPIEGDHVTGIRQTSGEFALDTEKRQTSAARVADRGPAQDVAPRRTCPA